MAKFRNKYKRRFRRRRKMSFSKRMRKNAKSQLAHGRYF